MRDRGLLLMVILAWASTVSADTITLKDHREPIQGEVVEETDEAFLIEVPKAQITRVERTTPFATRSTVATPKVLWEERDGYLVIQIPQEHVERRSMTASAAPSLRGVSPLPPGDEGSPPAAVTAPAPLSPHVDGRLGSIAGRVLWDGRPLAGCKVKIVMVSSPQPLAMVRKLLGHAEAYADEEGYVAEAATEASGRYRLERVPPGEYDIYWQPPGHPASQWIRRLQEQSDLVVLAGEVTTPPDIEAHVKTRN